MFAKAITLPRCSGVGLLACALLLSQTSDRDRAAIERAEATFVKSAAGTREERLAWWREAKFGCFIHWGVYSGPGGEWEGRPFAGYAEHLMRIKKIPLAVYKEKVVAPFNPTKFDAEEWVSVIK